MIEIDLRMTASQDKLAAELQRALRQLPIEVVLNHIEIAMRERGDMTIDYARQLENAVGRIVWEFY